MLYYAKPLQLPAELDHKALQSKTDAEDWDGILAFETPHVLHHSYVLIVVRRAGTRTHNYCGKLVKDGRELGMDRRHSDARLDQVYRSSELEYTIGTIPESVYAWRDQLAPIKRARTADATLSCTQPSSLLTAFDIASKMAPSDTNQEVFQQLKACCVPLLGSSNLTPGSISRVSDLLSHIIQILHEAQSRRVLTVSLVSYVFFPISTILRRNAPSAIPDQVLEKVFAILALLCERWWWDMDVTTWEQIFMLSGAILAGFDTKGKGKERADETREAAVRCLWALVHPRLPEEDPAGSGGIFVRSDKVFSKFQEHSRIPTFVPIMGQTVDSVLACTESQHLPLQRMSLSVLQVVIKDYLSDGLIPSILPGVVSGMCKVALGVKLHKTWTNGDVVAAALSVIQEVVLRAISDDICVQEGAVKGVQDLEDLVEIASSCDNTARPKPAPYATVRTTEWLRGTSSQLHIALNSLNLLVKHPSPTALQRLATLAAAILRATSLTLPQSQPLLLTILLSLSASDFDSVSTHASSTLSDVLNSNAQSALLPVLLQISKDYLASLPRLLPSHSDTKVEHVAQVIEAICKLATLHGDQATSGSAIAHGVAKLLGPSGGIEKWGWSLLSVLEISTPTITTAASAARLALENDSGTVEWMPFPPVNLVLLLSRSAQEALERMFRALGSAAGDAGLYTVEWFFSIGRGSITPRAIAALWCGCRLLEGVGHVSLEGPGDGSPIGGGKHRRTVEKFARGVTKQLAEVWDEESDASISAQDEVREDEDAVNVEHLSGLVTVRTPLEVAQHIAPQSHAPRRTVAQPELQKALALQAIAISSGILQARFTPLLLNTLYPVLHSLVSKNPHLSSTALSTLHYITHITSHASPSNLLLSNFDYALDAVSRHLNRRWLDVDAAAVLVILVRLVGRDVVRKAGDVVDECFDRLDEYHGYEVVVDGLIAVLSEVVDVIGSDELNRLERNPPPPVDTGVLQPNVYPVETVLEWLKQREEGKTKEQEAQNEDFGPVPQKAWGKSEELEEEDAPQPADPTDEKPATPTQALIQHIVSRSMFFLTHGSPTIRARILTLLGRAVPVLPDTSLLPSVHHAWPFILNRLSDPEPFVLSAAATLIELLATHVGDFMFRRIWDDVWPRFRTMLAKLDAADAQSALARRGHGAVGTESAHTHSHRLYRAIIRTMAATAKGVQTNDDATWEVIVTFRRFLHRQAHEELQASARDLYKALSRNNEDAVWLALSATMGEIDVCSFMHETKWDIAENTRQVLGSA
ncbi:hypothetical protein NM688_g7089 [Phlebia brevispora]|uniref:Uncharacterized protein n=1 Tax=Phlebia brevispora TaxID=194682 RepID=A0ACC1S999_9APHY|nr:hypothetical protein NM688_g7089 [Phlebia brevispora]